MINYLRLLHKSASNYSDQKSIVNKLYKELQLIVYKQKYLIPAKPKPLMPFYTYFKQSIKGKGYSQQQINQTYKSNKDDLKTEIYAEYKKKVDEQKKIIEEYNQKYIEPPQYPLFHTFKLFLSINHYNINEGSVKWKQLNEQQRLKIEQQAKDIKCQLMKKFEQYRQIHEIPIVTKINKSMLFLKKSHKQGSFTHEQFDQYRNLQQQQKQKLQREAMQHNKQKQEQYNNFLKKWNITTENLQYIQRICKERQYLKKIMKRSTKENEEQQAKQS